MLIAAFLLHNSEEAIMMYGKAAESPVSFVKPLNFSQFLIAVTFLSVVAIIAYIAAMKSKSSSVYLFISTAIAAAMLLNVFIPHIAINLMTLKYTPGLTTAVTLNLPISLLMLSKNKQYFRSRKQMFLYLLTGLVIGYGLFAASTALVKMLF